MLAKKAKDVLATLHNSGVLQDLILVGSWCCHFYISYFGRKYYTPLIKTLDIDLLIPNAKKLPKGKIDIGALLEEKDFDSEVSDTG